MGPMSYLSERYNTKLDFFVRDMQRKVFVEARKILRLLLGFVRQVFEGSWNFYKYISLEVPDEKTNLGHFYLDR